MNLDHQIREFLTNTEIIARKLSTEDIHRVATLLFNAWKSENRIFICGNGGSASTAAHFTCDLIKTTAIQGKTRFRSICLNDNIPLMLALINDEGFENLFYEQLVSQFSEGDVLVCISVHGGAGADKAGAWSQNLLKAARYAQDNGGSVIGFSGFDGGPLKEMADACIVVPADSTPQVESFHLLIEHLICDCLKEMIGHE